jgi:hypothetical protein
MLESNEAVLDTNKIYLVQIYYIWVKYNIVLIQSQPNILESNKALYINIICSNQIYFFRVKYNLLGLNII